MGMSKAAKMMMMGGDKKHDYAYNHDRDYEHPKKDYDGKIRAGGTFWMDDPRNKHMKLDRETAEHWVSEMDKPEGGKGGKWSYEQTSQVMRQKGMEFDPVVWYCVLNMLYSDYSKTLSKYGVTSVDAYVDLAKDWIDDDDVKAADNKTAMYYNCIVK